MSTITRISATAPQPMPPDRITVDQYDRMIEAGTLSESDKVELIDGMLVAKMPKSPEHSYATKKVVKLIDGMLAAGWTSRSEQPVRIPDYDEPEPDCAIVRGTDEDYRRRHPGPDDTVLVAEVAVTSIGEDRGKKLSAYAAAGIPVYWIVNVEEARIEVYGAPSQTAYQSRTEYKLGQLVPVVIDGVTIGQIAVDRILP